MHVWRVLSLMVAAFVLSATLSWAGVPKKINYQGYLTNPAGSPLTGTYSMVFSLCTAATGGTCPWDETQSVAVDKGIFNVTLGSVTTLTLTFDVPYFLDIQVGGEQMGTRQPLTSVGYAFTADTAAAAATATNFSGSLSGDVTGTQTSTVVGAVGGQSAASVASGVTAANNATSTNTASTIVKRDASGNFAVGTVSGNLTGAASLNVLKSGDTMTGNLTMATQNQLRLQDASGSNYLGVRAPEAVTTSYTLTLPADTGTAGKVLATDGSGTLSWANATPAGALVNGGNAFGGTGVVGTTDGYGLNLVTSNLARLQISSTGTVSIPVLSTPGVVHNDASGNLSSSQVVNADIAAAAGIADTKLATISTAGKVANSATTATSANTASTIVARDGSGNFSAGTITASLTGNVTGNVSGTAANVTGTVAIVNGGTGATTAVNALNNFLPSQTGNSGKVLSTNGSGTVSWISAGGGADATLPVPGNSGTLTATNSGLDIVLTWTAATDNVTPQANLEYTVFYSTTNNINTVANAEANGTVIGMSWSSNITSKTVTGLTIGTTYYFNVAVKDAGLNKAVYTTVSKAPTVPTTNIILYESGTASAGNMGGRSGANALCAANKPAGFTNYAAFLSVSGSDSIAGRQAFAGLDTARTVRSKNGTLIANNWSDLLDGSIGSTLAGAGISLPSGYWWSGSNADGTVGLTCSGWTSSVNPASGSDPSGDWGTSNNTNSLWIYPGVVDRTFCADPTEVLCIAW